MKKKDLYKIERDDFISFLASATPEEVNEYIRERGKPMKPIEPMIFFEKDKSKSDE